MKEEDPLSVMINIKLNKEKEKAKNTFQREKTTQIQQDYIKVDNKLRRLYKKVDKTFDDLFNFSEKFNKEQEELQAQLNQAAERFKKNCSQLKKEIKKMKEEDIPLLEEEARQLKQAMIEQDVLVPATKR